MRLEGGRFPAVGSDRLLARFFILSRRSDFGDEPVIARSEFGEILPGLRQRKASIRAASHFIGIVVVLAIIFPETDRANLIAPSFIQCPVAAARTAVLFFTARANNRTVIKLLDILLKPEPTGGFLLLAILVGRHFRLTSRGEARRRMDLAPRPDAGPASPPCYE